MTPCQKIKREILLQVANDPELSSIVTDTITESNVDVMYNELVEHDAHWDYESEFRGGQVETAIPCEWSRHYESKSVAMKCCDGTWVDWTYWYGGGKYGQPGEIEWMTDAYNLKVTETERLVTVREFERGN